MLKEDLAAHGVLDRWEQIVDDRPAWRDHLTSLKFHDYEHWLAKQAMAHINRHEKKRAARPKKKRSKPRARPRTSRPIEAVENPAFTLSMRQLEWDILL